jgi:hypothetical protein
LLFSNERTQLDLIDIAKKEPSIERNSQTLNRAAEEISMRLNTLMVLASMFVTSLASAQHCRKADIDKSSGYCTVPDPLLTPGEMDASLACSNGGRLRQVSASTQNYILVAYGYSTDTDKSSGEFDHWFPEWMGGSDGPKNIWFEPHAGKFGSYAKDKVEHMLWQKVCVDHTMSLVRRRNY